MNGTDASGRRVNGSQSATIKASMIYSGSYKRTIGFGSSSDSESISTGYSMVIGKLPDVYFTRTFNKTLSAWGADTLGLGGWTLSPVHVYDTVGHILYQGDGRQRNVEDRRTLKLIAGNGTAVPSASGQPAVTTGIPTSEDLPSLAVASNGDVYFLTAEPGPLYRRELRKIGSDRKVVDVLDLGNTSFGGQYRIGRSMAFSPDGKYLYIPTFTQILRVDLATKTKEVFAGTGVASELEGPANQATFQEAVGVAVAPDGTLYVADFTQVRKIATDDAHTVSTVAGSSNATLFCNSSDPNFSANGKPAKLVKLAGLVDQNWKVTVAPDGALLIGSSYDLIRVDPSGIVSCRDYSPGEVNGAVAVASDSTVYFGRNDVQDTQYPSAFAIRKLNPDGSNTVVAGGQGCGEPVDGAAATNTKICNVTSMAPCPDGSLYFFNTVGAVTRIYQLTAPAMTGAGNCAIALPSESGTETFCFDSTGRHLSTRNAVTGKPLLTFNYTNGLVTSIVDADRNTTTIAGATNQVVITGPFGQTTKIGLDPTTKYAKYIEDAVQKQTLLNHDSNGLLLSMTDRNGQPYTFSYDTLGRLKRDSDPAGGSQILDRSTVMSGYTVSNTTAMGRLSSYAVSVDAQGNETRTVGMPDGSQNQSTLSSRASTTTFADKSSQVATIDSDPLWPSFQPYVSSSVTTLPAISSGTLTRTVTRTKEVGLNGTTPPTVNTVTERVSVNAGQPLVRAFDVATKTYTVTSPGGRRMTVTVDDADRPLTVTVPGVDPVMYDYDQGRVSLVAQGSRQTRNTFYPAGQQGAGFVSTSTAGDPSANTRTFFYRDDAGTVYYTNTSKDTLSSPSVETDFSWDPEGNLKTLAVYPSGGTHVQTYTPVNLVETYQAPRVAGAPAAPTQFFYNKDRSLEFVRQPGGRSVDYVYKANTQQLVSVVADGAQEASFNYYPDSTCTGCASGRLQVASRGSTDVTLAYNGPLTTSQTWSGSSAAGSVGWVYTSEFRVASETVSPVPTVSGLTTVSYAYDPDGMPTCASLSTCAPSASNKLTLNYSPTTGALTDTALGSVTDSYTRNEYGELASYTAKYGTSTLFSMTYDDGSPSHARDGLGRVRRETDANGSSADYEYDDQGRLWKVTQDGYLVQQFSYDERGNRLSDDPLGTVIARYDAQDRLLDYAGTTYTYGGNGELKKRTRPGAIDEYQYDALGNLSQVKTPYKTVDYVVDAFNRRITKKLNGTALANYIYRDGLKLAAVLDGAGNLAARFVYASRLDIPDFMVLRNGTVYRFLADQRGSPRLIVNAATGAIAQRIDYDAFGNANVQNFGLFPAWQQPFGFAGGLYDQDTGLVRFGARDYDPQVGRWISKDPILFGGGQANFYVYVGNDPVDFVDPSGDFVNVLIGAAIGGAAGALGAYVTGGDVLAGAAGGLVTGGLAGLTLGASLGVQISAGVGSALVGLSVNQAVRLTDGSSSIGPSNLLASGLGGAAGPLVSRVVINPLLEPGLSEPGMEGLKFATKRAASAFSSFATGTEIKSICPVDAPRKR